MLPADIDSITPPPNGEDQFAIGSLGDIDNSHLSLYSVHINDPSDWTQGATFTGDNDSQLMPIATFTPACNGAYGGACVPQKGITDLADSLGDRLMYRFAYWEDQPLANVTGNSAEAGSGTALVRELGRDRLGWQHRSALDGGHRSDQGRSSRPPSRVFQQGTYAPDGNWRWMGSIARDKVGDILLGYSESCGSTCPGGTNGGVYPVGLRSRTPGQRSSGPRQSGS